MPATLRPAIVLVALFTALLRDHVHGDEVDYRLIQKDPRLDTYLAQLATTDPKSLPSRDAQLAFWINAYNAYTLKLITSVYPVDTIRAIHALDQTGSPDTGHPWDIAFAEVALVCASVSCPKLRNEAYVPHRLEDQLNDQGRWFLTHRNQLDGRRRTAQLSQLFTWFADDFGSSPANILDFIADFATPGLPTSLRLSPDRWKLTYLDYDWSLNDRR